MVLIVSEIAIKKLANGQIKPGFRLGEYLGSSFGLFKSFNTHTVYSIYQPT